jgi:hypothetical protein
MRTGTKILTVTTAALGAAVFFLAGTVYAAPGQGAAQPAATAIDLRSVLLPPDQHPAGTTVTATVTLQDAVAQSLPGTGLPAGATISPPCPSYLDAIGGLGTKNGWFQYGTRSNGAMFINVVATVPGGNAVDRMRAAVAACSQTNMTLQGVVTTKLAFAPTTAPVLSGATTFELTQSVTVPATSDPAALAIIESYHFESGHQCVSEAVFVGTGDTLLWVVEPDAAFAQQIATTLYGRTGAYRASWHDGVAALKAPAC